MTAERKGPFWDFLAGNAPAPPVAEHLGWKLRAIDPDAGTIEVEFEAKREFLNPRDNVQGGIVAAMLDDTMGPALAATLGPQQFAPTVEMKVNFLRPARLGKFVGKGRVVHRGRSIAFVEGELRDAEDHLVATASATLRIMEK